MRDCQNKEGKIDLAKIGTNRDKTFLRIHTTVIRVMASSLRSLEFSLSHFKKDTTSVSQVLVAHPVFIRLHLF